ncbi:MAG: hypothetical protein GX230_01435 [Lentisphaerae bacterium]|jgi:uroporphyrinogen decarboxylase|nr:hypothetical protein [Lentisphaerota bacterium]
MKTVMTAAERFTRMYQHQEADRIPVIDLPWSATIERWQSEGMPCDIDYCDFFGLDKVVHYLPDNSPRYEAKTIEETDEYHIYTSSWGVTQKSWKHMASTPEFLDFTIKDRESWSQAKERMTPTRDRINWSYLADNYPRWQREGYWIEGGLWFGFDVTHSWAVGTERVLMALVEDPEWCIDMFGHYLQVGLSLLDQMWEAGYRFHCISWPDDMGYKNNQFFSLQTYRDLLKPFHKQAVAWAHAKGIKARLHSCGNITPFIPELVEIGMDGLNPLEVKAGMDPLHIKHRYGKDLLLHGGINAVLWDKPEQIRAEMAAVIPELKKGGGYIFSSDHSVPSSVSLDDFRNIVNLAKELGSYE